MSAPGIIVAAPASGAGKTTLSLGIMAALRRRGLVVGSFKVGPDYIDPAFHAAATGRAAYNIDPWAMRFETLAGLLEESGRGCDLLIGEGVMGLFDGAADGTGSTADIAALFGLPVLLTVDVTGMGASVAALIDGFRRHREDVEVQGVLLNRIASPAHLELLSRACFEHVSTPVLGSIPRDTGLALPSRHLGLVQAVEHPDLATFLTAAADLVEARLDLERIQRLARSPSVSLLGPDTRPLPPLGQRTAVARDRAFALHLRRRAGRMAAAGRRAAAVLATGRPGAGCHGGFGLSARRLSGAAPGGAGRQLHLHGRASAPQPNGVRSSTGNAAAT